jgi:hypothetical protein
MGSFRKAIKSKSKLRLAIYGAAGSGKTYSALEIATGMIKDNESIAVTDTEKGSSQKYADRFTFDIAELEEPTIDHLVKTIKEAENNYTVLIIDSLSHSWEELLIENHKLAQTKYKGNTWAAWNEGTPKQKKLINAITGSSCHIIATMRTKTEWVIGENNRPIRVGLAPEQGKGIEFEFDMLMEINPEHAVHILKDRTGKFQDQVINKPSREFGASLIEWLNNGVDPIDLEKAFILKIDSYNSIEELMSHYNSNKILSKKYQFKFTERKEKIEKESEKSEFDKLLKEINGMDFSKFIEKIESIDNENDWYLMDDILKSDKLNITTEDLKVLSEKLELVRKKYNFKILDHFDDSTILFETEPEPEYFEIGNK